MKENGETTNDNHLNNKNDTSFPINESPYPSGDFGTGEEEIKNKELIAHLLEQQKKRREILEELIIREEGQKEFEEEREILYLYSIKEKFKRRNAWARNKSKAIDNRALQNLDKLY